MHIANGFHSAATGYKHWNGVLVQLGTFKNAALHHEEIELFLGGSSVIKFAHDEVNKVMWWVNVVSDNPGLGMPMDPSEIWGLFPDANPCVSCCGTTTLAPECLRNQKIHGEMIAVTSVITYWQGQNGYDMQARRANTSDWESSSRFEFTFGDDYSVDVYRIHDDDADGTWVLDSPISYTSAEVDQIAAWAGPGGPGFSSAKDPPWPFP